MKINKEMLDMLVKFDDKNYEYDYIGIRVQPVEFKLGPIHHKSHIWVNGEDSGVELNGICVVGKDAIMKSIEACKPIEYEGDHAAIIGGYCKGIVTDDSEILLDYPVVIEIIC